MANRDMEILRYLHSIDDKLDRLNERLDRLLAGKGKQAARTADAGDPRMSLVAHTPEDAEELRKKYPDADIIVTNVPRTKGGRYDP